MAHKAQAMHSFVPRMMLSRVVFTACRDGTTHEG
jgi:hypothetical protein